MHLDAAGADMPVDLGLASKQVPPGLYRAELRHLELSVGQASGEPYYRAKFVVMDSDEYADCEVETVISFAPTAKGWTRRKLETIAGKPLPEGIVNVADAEFQAQFLNRRVRLRLVPSTRIGWSETEVAAILPE
jgi:hypothetical protein